MRGQIKHLDCGKNIISEGKGIPLKKNILLLIGEEIETYRRMLSLSQGIIEE